MCFSRRSLLWLAVCWFRCVPQGSILGPLLFIIHINDLPSFVSFSSTLLYADDTKLSTPVSSPSDCSLLQFDIQALERWGSQSGLSFNASKSFLMRFCNRSPLASVDYSLKDSVIFCVSSCRDLGVIFSSDLSWTEHYKVISRNAYNQLYVIKRSFSAFCPPPIKRLLYISLVHSKLSYYSQVFGDQCSLKTSSLWKGFSIGPPNLLLVLPPSAIENDSFHNICCHLCIFMNTWMSCSVSSASWWQLQYTRLYNFLLSHYSFQFFPKTSLKHCSTNRSRHFYFNWVTRLWNALPLICLSPYYKSAFKQIPLVTFSWVLWIL